MNVESLDSSRNNNVVAIHNDSILDRTTFWRRVNGLTKLISDHPAERWALICEDSAWFATGLFALAISQRVIVLPQVPMTGSLRASKIHIDAILSDAHHNSGDTATVTMHADMMSASASPSMPDDETLIELHTSGSTGMPKCVPKRFKQLRHEVETLERQWGAQLGNAIIAGTVPHYHLYGLLFRILWPILSKRTFQSGVYLHPASLQAAAADARYVIVSSPAFLNRIDSPSDLPKTSQVTAVFSSGAPLADKTAKLFAEDWGRAVIEVYGSTETGGIAWRSWTGPHDRSRWQLIHGVEVALRDDPAGRRLWVRSRNTWQREWVATGDLARGSGDGQFELLERADDVIKIADKRISLSEISAYLITHAWVQDARLVSIQGQRTLIGAALVLNADGQTALATSGKTAVCGVLRAWLRNCYEPVMMPRKWRFVAALPGTNMGKIEHQRLLRLFDQPS